MKSSLRSSPTHVVEPKYNLVGSHHGHLASGRIPIRIYLRPSRSRRNRSTRENPDLHPIELPVAMSYSDMGSSNSARGDLRRSRSSKIETVASNSAIMKSSIRYMILANLLAPHLSRQQYHPSFFLSWGPSDPILPRILFPQS